MYGNNNMCCLLTCVVSLVSLALLVWILVKQHKCCKDTEKYHREYDGVASSMWEKYH